MPESLPGVNAWLPPTYGPKRRYEPPTCERGARYVGHVLTLADRLVVAGFVVPRMRAGSMPRVIHVGATGRTVTGEQLGAALLRRVDIEVDAVRPPTVCPGCGGAKLPTSERCVACVHRQRRHMPCACGGVAERGCRLCRACADAGRVRLDAALATAIAAYANGASMSAAAKAAGIDKTTVRAALEAAGVEVRPYDGAARATAAAKIPRRSTCAKCGRPSRGKVCGPCRLRRVPCACGGSRDPRAESCAVCAGRAKRAAQLAKRATTA